jgi:enolase
MVGMNQEDMIWWARTTLISTKAYMQIKHIYAQEILDSRGNPTVEATVELADGVIEKAAVPSGASTGIHEALELRDNDPNRYGGKGVQKAVANVNGEIAKALAGLDAQNQEAIDRRMIELDGTETKSRLGANALLAVSMAVARAAARSIKVPLYRHIAHLFSQDPNQFVMPVPMINVLNGGKHAIRSTDLQEYMILPVRTNSMAEAIRVGAEVFEHLAKVIKGMGYATTVGDEGGFAPSLASNEQPFDLLTQAVTHAGYTPGKDVVFGIDAAASSFYENGSYVLAAEQKTLSTAEMVEMYVAWADKHPLVTVEDMFHEEDWQGFVDLNQRIGNRVQTVGDDLYVTNVKILKKGIELKASNAILIKVNQIGTVWETIEAVTLAKQAGMQAIVSHRSGETEDTFIADFVVGAGTGQIKTGSMSRSERIAKYNRLMSIERELGEQATMAVFPYGRA